MTGSSRYHDARERGLDYLIMGVDWRAEDFLKPHYLPPPYLYLLSLPLTPPSLCFFFFFLPFFQGGPTSSSEELRASEADVARLHELVERLTQNSQELQEQVLTRLPTSGLQ